MAEGEEKSPLDKSGEQILTLLFGSWLVLEFISRTLEHVSERWGIDILDPAGTYRRMTTLSEDTRPGTSVETTQGVDVFSNPGGGRLLGFQTEGSEGQITGGPETVQGDRWWDVNFSEGADGWTIETALENASAFSFVDTLIVVLIALSIIISLVLFAAAAYASIRVGQIRAEEKRKLTAVVARDVAPVRNERWERVLAHADSTNPNDWRAAIIEADVILDELVTRMGYRGEGLGDKLKQIDRSDFVTIDRAWEAHKIRNRIAHSGSDYILTQRETARVIELYRQVFDEFYYI